MKKIIILIIVFYIHFIGFSQNWQIVATNTTDEIKDMYFKNEFIGFAVAGQGKILKTVNGGLNWILIYENSELFQEQSIVATNDKVYCFAQNFQGTIKFLRFNIDLNDFVVSNALGFFAVPNELVFFNNLIFGNGIQYNDGIITSLNGISSDISEITNNFSNLSTSNGNKIFYSFNGSLWNNIQFDIPFLTSDPYQSYYDGVSKMRTVTNYPCKIHISNDNGLNWTHTLIQSTTAYFLTFLTAEKVLALNLFNEENKIYFSINSGLTFGFETILNPIKKIYSFNANLSFAYGNNGVLYRSTNGGGLLGLNGEEKKNDDNIKLYPNPVTQEFKILNANNLKIDKVEIIDNCGRSVKTIHSLLNQTSINVSGLSAGVYSVILVCNGVAKDVKSLIIQ